MSNADHYFASFNVVSGFKEQFLDKILTWMQVHPKHHRIIQVLGCRINSHLRKNAKMKLF